MIAVGDHLTLYIGSIYNRHDLFFFVDKLQENQTELQLQNQQNDRVIYSF